MKKFRKSSRIVLLVVVLITVSVSSYALSPWDYLRMGVDVNYFDYEEPGVMNETGVMAGIYGLYTFDYLYPLTFSGYGSMSFGNLDYDGAIVYEDGTEEPLQVSTPNFIFNMRGISGLKLRAEDHVWTPYIGLGYRYLEDDLPTQYGYIREQTYYYVPVGVMLMFVTKFGWSFEGTLEYDIFLDGRNRSYGGALGPGITVHQNSGQGARASVNFLFPKMLYPNYPVKFNIEPFVEYWDINDSNVVNGFYEPANESTMFGMRLGMEF